MADDPALVRQWRLIKVLSGNRFGASVQELAQEMKVAEKTIRRDLQTFDQVGFPLEETTGDHGRKTWRMQAGHGQPELNSAFDEELALYLGRSRFKSLLRRHRGGTSHRLLRKLSPNRMPPSGSGAIECRSLLLEQRIPSFYGKTPDALSSGLISISHQRSE